MRKFFIMTFVRLRWLYFQLHPNYFKFYIATDEPHFQHKKTGVLYCNFKWVN